MKSSSVQGITFSLEMISSMSTLAILRSSSIFTIQPFFFLVKVFAPVISNPYKNGP
jgi:hypothetical protein